MMLYMGRRQKEAIEQFQKEQLRAEGLRIVAVDPEEGSPFDIVEGLRFIKQGGLVAMAGDLLWKSGQRSVTVSFLGHRVDLPVAPYVVALTTGAPLLVFFSFRTGRQTYHFSFSAPIFLDPRREKRTEAVQQAAQQYARMLEEALRRHPFEWYHFDAFLGETIPGGEK